VARSHYMRFELLRLWSSFAVIFRGSFACLASFPPFTLAEIRRLPMEYLRRGDDAFEEKLMLRILLIMQPPMAPRASIAWGCPRPVIYFRVIN